MTKHEELLAEIRELKDEVRRLREQSPIIHFIPVMTPPMPIGPYPQPPTTPVYPLLPEITCAPRTTWGGGTSSLTN